VLLAGFVWGMFWYWKRRYAMNIHTQRDISFRAVMRVIRPVMHELAHDKKMANTFGKENWQKYLAAAHETNSVKDCIAVHCDKVMALVVL
jgi:hypothetical protein